jgi:MFS family permease
MFRAFAIPSFRYLWINTITFSLVQGMALLTFLQLARELSESNTALGFFGFAVGIPVLIFGLPIGIIADRVDRRLLITASHIVACVAALGLALLHWTGDLNLALALILAGVSGLGVAI